jgi:hypothetical protein
LPGWVIGTMPSRVRVCFAFAGLLSVAPACYVW